MPKLIIKRETPQRFTWQAILFWVLGLLPVALLAGFLTGNLISQLQRSSSKAGEAPLLPLAPLVQPNPLPKQSSSNLPFPVASEQPQDTVIEKPISALDTNPKSSTKELGTPKTLNKSLELNNSTHDSPKKQTGSNTLKNQANQSIKRANTKDQQNNRNRPAITPSQSNKPVKSPQTVSESPRPSRTVIRTHTEASAKPVSKPPSTAQTERGNKDDYRLLEQSLGIPLQ